LAVYQQTVHRPRLRATDRVLWAWLARLWPGWREALAFVQPRTVIAWQRQRFRDHWRHLSQQGTPGRPAVAREVRALIQAMWQANPTWGSPRIVGELRKLGLHAAKSTVETYRVRPRQPPSPMWFLTFVELGVPTPFHLRTLIKTKDAQHHPAHSESEITVHRLSS
jgi:hypothetical protein